MAAAMAAGACVCASGRGSEAVRTALCTATCGCLVSSCCPSHGPWPTTERGPSPVIPFALVNPAAHPLHHVHFQTRCWYTRAPLVYQEETPKLFCLQSCPRRAERDTLPAPPLTTQAVRGDPVRSYDELSAARGSLGRFPGSQAMAIIKEMAGRQ